MEKLAITFDSRGPSGNIYRIVGMARDALRKQRRIIDYNSLWERVQSAKSYEEALTIIREYVNLVDIRGEK